MTGGEDRFDLAALRRKLATRRGPALWRSLEELAETPAFLARLGQEFPAFATAVLSAVDRRRFLQLTAASLALAGLGGCGREVEQRQLLPYVEQPEGMVPGRARYYATATDFDSFGHGVLVKHEMGRPLKIEGNPDHPASRGGTSAIGQASILSLYDPYRAQTITRDGTITTWQDALTMLNEHRARLAERHGSGFRILTADTTSPTLRQQMTAIQSAFPEMRWHQWMPLHRDTAYDGARIAFGREVDLVLDLDAADIILGIESDIVSAAPGHLRYARDFARRRRAGEAKERTSRLYALESTPTLFGAKADHRLVLAPAEIGAALRVVAAMLNAGPADWRNLTVPHAEALHGLVADLKAHPGRSLIHAGREQPADIHALTFAINGALGNLGATMHTIEPIAARPAEGHAASLAALVADMDAGKVDTLLILGVNAVYTAPANLDFSAALGKVGHSLYLGEYADETAVRCHWHVPAAHELEAWSDIRAFDGTVTIQQPQIRPLYGGHSAHELLSILLGSIAPDDHALLRRTWQRLSGSGAPNFESFWSSSLRAGVVANSAAPEIKMSLHPSYAAAVPSPPHPQGLSLLFRPDIGVWDGRYAGNGWLQEMPRPFTRFSWDNAALIAPATAQSLNLAEGDMVELALADRKIRAPIWVHPGQAATCITLALGYGRARAGPVGTAIGVDAYPLRHADSPWQAFGAQLTRVAELRHQFAAEQIESFMEGRDLIREADLNTLLEDAASLAYHKNDESLYPGYRYDGIAWAMSISLNSCIGCQACVIACQAENNIPVVGKAEVERGRVMHWLRIDRYYQGDLDQPAIDFQPVPCMHCENAPCEVVCPVQATVHDSEGLNVMVYNRCVGTRFCSNNCPYKVRRFNWFDYSAAQNRPRESWNPDLSVRGRGVMEKCTYCVQRTRAAMIEADKENRTIRDGDVMTACQQACPTEAIVFGNRNDRESAIAARKKSPLDYPILDDLNTRPRTTYEMIVRNPNPAIKSS